MPLDQGFAIAILATVKKRLEEGYGGAVQDLQVPKGRDGKLIDCEIWGGTAEEWRERWAENGP